MASYPSLQLKSAKGDTKEETPRTQFSSDVWKGRAALLTLATLQRYTRGDEDLRPEEAGAREASNGTTLSTPTQPFSNQAAAEIPVRCSTQPGIHRERLNLLF